MKYSLNILSYRQYKKKKWKDHQHLENLSLFWKAFRTQKILVTYFWSILNLIKKNAIEKQIFFNEIYTPIFEKKKVLSANEKSVFQLLDAMRLNDKGLINSYKITAKTHATMDKKFNIPLYVEHLHFLLSKCSWRVRNVLAYYTFEQSKLKNDFVIMNQVSCQNATTDVKRDFFKLMKNSNFGFDCRYNADNFFFSANLWWNWRAVSCQKKSKCLWSRH